MDLLRCASHPYLFPATELPAASDAEAAAAVLEASPKLHTLVKLLQLPRVEPRSQVLVVSQFARLLALVGPLLERHGMQHVLGAPQSSAAIDERLVCLATPSAAVAAASALPHLGLVILCDIELVCSQAISVLMNTAHIRGLRVLTLMSAPGIEETLLARHVSADPLQADELPMLLRAGAQQVLQAEEDYRPPHHMELNGHLPEENAQPVLPQARTTPPSAEENVKFWQELLGDAHSQLSPARAANNKYDLQLSPPALLLNIFCRVPSFVSDRDLTRLDATANAARLFEKPALPPTDGEGAARRVLGFTAAQRESFVQVCVFAPYTLSPYSYACTCIQQALLSYGFTDASCEPILRRDLSLLHNKHPDAIAEYGNTLMVHLLENPAEDAPSLFLQSEVPGARQALRRVAAQRLIEEKVRALPPAGSEELFDIEDGFWTDVHRTWSEQWGAAEDRLLLIGVVRHGHGQWARIAEDHLLNLMPALTKTLSARVAGALPDDVIAEFLLERVSLLENALFVEKQLAQDLPALPSPELGHGSNTPQRFMDGFKRMYNFAFQIRKNAPRSNIEPLPAHYEAELRSLAHLTRSVRTSLHNL